MIKYLNLHLKIIFLFIAILLSFTSVALILHATAWGPWAFSDSAAYISSARNLNNGMGLVLVSASGKIRPLEHYPPLYPMVLSLLARLGADYLPAVRIMDAALFGILIFIFSFGIFTLTCNFWLAIIGSSLILVSPVLLEAYTGVMSEPLFITLFYASLLLLLIYVYRRNIYLLIFAAILTGVSPLIRYIGVFAILINAILLLILEKSTWKKRLHNFFIFGFITVTPFCIWLLFMFSNSGTMGARGFLQATNLLEGFSIFFRDAGRTFKSWLPYLGYRNDLFPDNIKTAFFGAIAIFLILVGFILLMKNRHAKHTFSIKEQLLISAFLTIIIYLLALCVSYLFTIPAPDINSRMLSPLLPAMALLFVLCGNAVLANIATRFKSLTLIVIAFLTILTIRYYLLRTFSVSNEMYEKGYGYTSREMQTSGFLAKVRSLPSNEPMISNLPDLVLLYTNRMPFGLEVIPKYPFSRSNLSLVTFFREKHAALVLDFASIRNVHEDWQDRLNVFTWGMDINYEDAVGGIYYYPHEMQP